MATYRIVEVTATGMRMAAQSYDYGCRDVAVRAARMRAATNTDPAVVEIDVTNSGEVVFSAPASLIPRAALDYDMGSATIASAARVVEGDRELCRDLAEIANATEYAIQAYGRDARPETGDR